MRTAGIPTQLNTQRLSLNCWQSDDAVELLPILIANVEHLRDWIPEHVWTPLPLPELTQRLERFAADFAAEQEWRYAIRSTADGLLLGEAALFPRSPSGRVPFAQSDRTEIGYWLRADATGHGYASEAARALLTLSTTLPGIQRVEIRCDRRNIASAAVPQRLGFQLDEIADTPDPYALVWYRDLTPASTERFTINVREA